VKTWRQLCGSIFLRRSLRRRRITWRLYCRHAAAVIAVALLVPELLALGAESGVTISVAPKKPSRARIQFQPPELDVFANPAAPIAARPSATAVETPAASSRAELPSDFGSSRNAFERSLTNRPSAEPALETEPTHRAGPTPLVDPPQPVTVTPATDPSQSLPAAPPVMVAPRPDEPAPVILPGDLPASPTTAPDAGAHELPAADPSVPADNPSAPTSRWLPVKPVDPPTVPRADETPWSAFIGVAPTPGPAADTQPPTTEPLSDRIEQRTNPLRSGFSPTPENALRSAFADEKGAGPFAAQPPLTPRPLGTGNPDNVEPPAPNTPGADVDPRVILRLIDLVGFRKSDASEAPNEAPQSKAEIRTSDPAVPAASDTRRPEDETSIPASPAATPVEPDSQPTAPGLLSLSPESDAPAVPRAMDSPPASELVSSFPAATSDHPHAGPTNTMTVGSPTIVESSAASEQLPVVSMAGNSPTATVSTMAADSSATVASTSDTDGVTINIRATKPPAVASESSSRSVLKLQRTLEAADASPATSVPDEPAPTPDHAVPADGALAGNSADGRAATTTQPSTATGSVPLSELAQHIQVPPRVLNVPAPPLVATDPNPSNGDEPPSVAPASEPPVASTESKTPPATSPAASPQDSPPSVVASPAPPGAGITPPPDLPGAPRLRMETREAQLVRTEFDVTRAQSLDPRVCDVIQFAPRELTIVGKQQGITRVDFWQEGQEGKRQSYVVCVGTDESAQLRTQDQFAKLREVLRELYPASGVQLESQNGSLVVTGSARSKAEAIAIISLVRRMHTVPVVDNLEVRPE